MNKENLRYARIGCMLLLSLLIFILSFFLVRHTQKVFCSSWFNMFFVRNECNEPQKQYGFISYFLSSTVSAHFCCSVSLDIVFA